MKHMSRPLLPLTLCAALAASPVLSQSTEDGTGKSLMEEGMRLFFEGLQQQMEPTMDELKGLAEEMGPAMRGFFAEMGPALADLLEQVDDWSAYEAPEMLPNGDIIIRRKPDTPETDPEMGEDGQIEL
nr:hypothetical protein [Shimia biformata]